MMYLLESFEVIKCFSISFRLMMDIASKCISQSLPVVAKPINKENRADEDELGKILIPNYNHPMGSQNNIRRRKHNKHLKELDEFLENGPLKNQKESEENDHSSNVQKAKHLPQGNDQLKHWIENFFRKTRSSNIELRYNS